jgi:hypothetical protein
MDCLLYFFAAKRHVKWQLGRRQCFQKLKNWKMFAQTSKKEQPKLSDFKQSLDA